jgi:hypothetical protein
MKSNQIKIIFLIFFSLTFNSILTFSQDLSLKWSEKFKYDNRKDGFFREFLGSNDKYIYTLSNNFAIKAKKANKQVGLAAFDKTTMKNIARVSVKGAKSNKANQADYSDLKYFKTVIFNDEIFLFWLKRIDSKNDKKDELYVESFTPELKQIKKIKKIYTCKFPTDIKTSRYSSTSIVVLNNSEVVDKIIIGSEIPQKDDNVMFSFITLDKDLEVNEEQTIELPIKLTANKTNGLLSNYTLGKDENIYITSKISLTKEERKAAKKGEDLSYVILSILNTESGDLSNFEMRDNNKTINDVSYAITKNKIKIYGLFGDLEKDPSGNSTHGIFYTEVDSKSLEFEGLKYTYFDKAMISELFKNDAEDKKKTAALGKKKKSKAANNDSQALDTRFGIELLYSVDEENVVMFCSKMYNYSVTTCSSSQNGGTTCTTRYYCQKSNVTAIRIDNQGEILWASNIDRLYTYSGTDVYDVKVVYKNNKFYTIYASSYDPSAENKSRKSRKGKADLRDNFEYGVFDYKNGENTKNNFVVNQKNAEDKKTVNPTSITVMDNNFYVNYMVVKQKIGLTIPFCAAAIFFPPVAIIPFMNSDFKKGHGNLGVISVIEGGGSGKKEKKSKAPTKKK